MSGLIARMTIFAVIFTFVVSATPNTMISPGVPINGDRITRLDVQGGLIDLTPLIEQGEFQSQLAGLCPNGFNKVPLADLMVDLVEGGMGSFSTIELEPWDLAGDSSLGDAAVGA